MPFHDHRPRPLAVLHLAQPADGGVATVVTDLAAAQCAEGLRVHLACPPGGTLTSAGRRAGAEVHAWPATRAPGPALAAEVLRADRLVRRLRPDIVHLHSAKAGLAGRLALRGRVPTLFQPHAWSFDALGPTGAALALRWERAAAGWADRIVCVSADEQRRGARAGVTGRWAVVRNGVDLDRFAAAAPAARREARAALPALDGLPPGAPLVVCVARLSRQKGQDVLLRAWPAIAARHPGARLALVGAGPERGALLRRAPAGVVFAGAARDPVPWYRAADLAVLPSRWEGMALAPLEAMACGRPVVLTDVTGARESLPAPLRGPCLVPPDDAPALARAVGDLLAAPGRRAALGRAARDHVRTTHDVRHTAAQVLGLYRDLVRLPHPEHRERTQR
ncbi:glycosyltransferase [Streptomyces sp. TRM 70351]|uniref:glycosyltransferase n=1 Tax=Streptomyces sp. TRM 70351 TaxID=3116552 RepID=UPI002E7B87D6|nr:glycosyltransferase [Streptomyces sp. TRM 70351]MEE1929219.1 glycosyltransferase [Streptomyces sp. TRM 70351]